MPPTPLPASFGQNIDTDMALLWPDRKLELDFITDDYVTSYCDILGLVGDVRMDGQELKPFLVDPTGARSFGEATALVHASIKKAIREKYAKGK